MKLLTHDICEIIVLTLLANGAVMQQLSKLVGNTNAARSRSDFVLAGIEQSKHIVCIANWLYFDYHY